MTAVVRASPKLERLNLRHVAVGPGTLQAVAEHCRVLEELLLSTCADGLRASADAVSWELSAAEMREIDAMPSPKGSPTLFSSPGCPDSYFAPLSLFAPYRSKLQG